MKYADDYEDWFIEKPSVGVRKALNAGFSTVMDRKDYFSTFNNKYKHSETYKKGRLERVRPPHRQGNSCTFTLCVNDTEVGLFNLDEVSDFMLMSKKYSLRVTVQ